MQGPIKLHNPDKFLEHSSFGSHFRDLRSNHFEPILCGFHGKLPQMWSSLYKSFTSDAIKLIQKKKKEFLALRAFRFTLS